jgi:hypothetical protein
MDRKALHDFLRSTPTPCELTQTECDTKFDEELTQLSKEDAARGDGIIRGRARFCKHAGSIWDGAPEHQKERDELIASFTD